MRKKAVVIIAIILIILTAIFIYNLIIRNYIYNISHEEIVYKYAEKYDIDPMLVFAIIKNESNFNKEVTSSKNAIGLMQILESTAEEIAMNLGIENVDLTDAEININIGTKYFSELENKYNGNYMLALAAYNAGQGNVDRWISEGIIKSNGQNLENIPFKETNMYVRKIVRDYKIYTMLYK